MSDHFLTNGLVDPINPPPWLLHYEAIDGKEVNAAIVIYLHGSDHRYRILIDDATFDAGGFTNWREAYAAAIKALRDKWRGNVPDRLKEPEQVDLFGSGA